MNWLTKIAIPTMTEDLPQKLAQAISYSCGGVWEVGPVKNWTQDLENITNDKRLGTEVGYSTSFWIHCKTGDDYFKQKWGVDICFTVTSGSSHTIFDSEKGDWDLSITSSVQWANLDSWTSKQPYPLLVKSVGYKENMKTIQEVANFVQESIWNSQKGEGDGDDLDGDDDSPFDPNPEIHDPQQNDLITV